jgi:pilus assembly protein FimV
VRNLTKTLAILSLLTPVVGYPLGVGDFKLHSALNQNLNAEIPITLSEGENIADIKVGLAPAAKFDEKGVPWTYFLSKIRFQVVSGKSGSAVIKISSQEALKEPFLNIVLEVSSPKGNVYREFTVLVDPPSTYQAPLPIVAPTTTSKPPIAAPSVPTSANKSVAPIATPISTATPVSNGNSPSTDNSYGPVHLKETLWSIAVKFSKEQGVSVDQMLMAIYEANPEAFNKNNAFGLNPGATLQIPDKAAATRLSLEQAKEAHAQLNKAWKSRAILPLTAAGNTPTKNVVSEVSANKNVALAPTNPTKPENLFAEDNRKPVAPIPVVAVPAAPEDRLATTQVKEKTAPILPNLAKEKVPVSADVSGSPSTDASLLNRVSALEKQLNATKKALAIKEKQIDKIKNQSGVTPAVLPDTTKTNVLKLTDVKPVEVKSTEKPSDIKPIETTPVPVKPVIQLGTIDPVTPFGVINSTVQLEAIKPALPLSELAPTAPVKPVDATPAPVVKPVDATPVPVVKPVDATPVPVVKPVDATPVPVVKPVDATPAPVVKPVDATPVPVVKPVDATPAPVVKPVDVTPVPVVKPVDATPAPIKPVEADEESEILGIPFEYLIYGGTAALTVFSILGFWVRNRRRAMEEPMFPPSTTTVKFKGVSSPLDDSGTSTIDSNLNTTFNPAEFQGKSIFEPDWNIDIEEQSEIDPISEADVYLAYARYQQAEELMRDAIKEHPNRDECKLKLLEIFYASENKEAFEQYASELAQVGKKSDPDFWEKVMEMGGEICPESTLFSDYEADATPVPHPVTPTENKDDTDTFDFDGFADSDTTTASVSNEKLTSPAAVGDGVPAASNDDFDLDDFDVAHNAEVAPAAVTKPASTEDFESFDFDDFAEDSKAKAAPAAVTKPASTEDFELFDFDDFAEDSKAKAAPAAVTKPASTEDFESFDFDDFAEDSKVEAAPATVTKPASTEDFESFDFDDFAEDSKVEVAPAAIAKPASTEDFESFDFDDFAEDSKVEVAPAAVAKPASAEDFESFDFDDFAEDSKAEAAQAVVTKPASTEDFESFDFDDFAEDSPVTTTMSADSIDDFDSFDFDLTDSNIDSAEALGISETRGSAIDLDLDFDFDMPIGSAGENQQGHFGTPDLTDMDDLETKLDLAKAYIEMGDPNAAKEITDEVLKNGTADQKKTAQSILERLK